MTLIIVDLEGTLADDKARLAYLPDDMPRFYNRVIEDPINPKCREVIQAIMDSEEDQDTYIACVTIYPRYYKLDNGEVIDVRRKIKNWARRFDLHFNHITMRHKEEIDGEDNKIKRVIKLILKHMDERTIYYLESDPRFAKEIKKRCPTAHVYLITYEGYSEIH
jgi:hypothetical protein